MNTEQHIMGSQHPSPNVKTFCNFEPQIWLEIVISRDAQSACLKGSRTSCREIIFGIFWPNFGQKISHHVMDASCRTHIYIYIPTHINTVPSHRTPSKNLETNPYQVEPPQSS